MLLTNGVGQPMRRMIAVDADRFQKLVALAASIVISVAVVVTILAACLLLGDRPMPVDIDDNREQGVFSPSAPGRGQPNLPNSLTTGVWQWCRAPAKEEKSPTRVTNDASFKQHLQWSPDGKQFLFTRIHEGKMAVWTCNIDGAAMKRLLPNVNTPHFDGSYSPDGKTILYVHDILQGTDGKLHIYKTTPDGAEPKVVIPNKSFEETPRWSPDGKSFLFLSTRDGNQEIYRADADGSNIRRLTNEIAADNNPAWSPDGKRIAFASHRTGNLEIWSMDVDGGNLKKLTDHPAMDFWPAWSPDGKSIAFTTNRDGNYEIYLMNADGTGVRNLTQHSASDTSACWSPDGKRLAFISTRAGGSDIYVIDVK